ncbi:MAG: Tad domain-containing protein [Deltaproteobacteria bacterium]|nr:Tad domain-containing protein [Deltaproteobacteria bacterium]
MCFNRTSNENGATLVVMVLGVIPIMAIIATLVVEMGRAELAYTTLQTTADAVALASTSRLDGTMSGWLAAKRAAINTLRKSMIFGSDGLAASPGYFEDTEIVSDQDSLESGSSKYQSTTYQMGNVHVVIERGFYGNIDTNATEHTGNCGTDKPMWVASNPLTKVYKFVKLEATCDFATRVIPNELRQNRNCNEIVPGTVDPPLGCNIAWIANATRVQLTVNPYPTFLLGLIPGGGGFFNAVSRQSIAALNTFPPKIFTLGGP